MPTYEVIITDVTRYGTLFCVAGWDLQNGGMIRPEPASARADNEASRFWGAEHAGTGKFFDVGNKVRFEAIEAPADFPFPHATEDRVFVRGKSPRIMGYVSPNQVALLVAKGISPSLHRSFGGHLVVAASGKAHVALGTRTCSLDAVELDTDNIDIYVEILSPEKRRVRLQIYEDGVKFDFPVPSDAIRRRFFTVGIDVLRTDVRDSKRVHLRLGLSRPFAAMPNFCYAQINGMYFL